MFILHREYKTIIDNFKKNYLITDEVQMAGFPKDSWQDNEEAIEAALKSKMQLVLYSGGPGGKIIGPQIANASGRVVLDIGNTLMPWSEKQTG